MPKFADVPDLYDSHLLGMLQNEENIQNFLDVMFSFLQRRTDFFVLLKDEKSTMGFPDGHARKLVNAIFSKHEHAAAEKRMKEERRQARCSARKNTDAKPKESNKATIDTNNTLIDKQCLNKKVDRPCCTSSDTNSFNASGSTTGSGEPLHQIKSANGGGCGSKTSTSSLGTGTASGQSGACRSANVSHINRSTTGTGHSTPLSPIPPTVPGQANFGAASNPSMTPSSVEVDDKDTSKSDNTQHSTSSDVSNAVSKSGEANSEGNVYQADPQVYNGAERDNYNWSQSITDLDVRVKIPTDVKKGNQVKVEVLTTHLKVSYLDVNGKWQIPVDEALCWPVNKEESLWTLVPGEHIHINMEKRQERWWEAVLENEPKINVRNIDASRPVTDLDEEAQAKVSEMVYNEQQKRLGKPQSHEVKVHDMLRKAWDCEGSPFRGQPFDPSTVNVMPGASGS